MFWLTNAFCYLLWLYILMGFVDASVGVVTAKIKCASRIYFMGMVFYLQITQLKIDHNPFAKGFRDNGSGRREKKYVSHLN